MKIRTVFGLIPKSFGALLFLGYLFSLNSWEPLGLNILLAISLGLMGINKIANIKKTPDIVCCQWRIYIIPVFSRCRELGTIHLVSMELKTRRVRSKPGTQNSGFSHRVEYYLVQLHGEQTIIVNEFKNAVKARRLAERLAEYFQAPLSDNMLSSSRVRQPSELNQAITEKAKNEDIDMVEPVLPSNSPIHYTRTANGADMRLQPQAYPAFYPIFYFSVILLFAYVVSFAEESAVMAYAILVIMMIIVFMKYIFSLIPIRVHIDPKRIRFRRCLLGKSFHLYRLEEVNVEGQFVFLVSDDSYFRFPYRFRKSDAVFFKQLIFYMARHSS